MVPSNDKFVYTCSLELVAIRDFAVKTPSWELSNTTDVVAVCGSSLPGVICWGNSVIAMCVFVLRFIRVIRQNCNKLFSPLEYHTVAGVNTSDTDLTANVGYLTLGNALELLINKITGISESLESASLFSF